MTHRRLIESLNLCFVILLFICLTGQCSGPADLASVETQGANTDQPE